MDSLVFVSLHEKAVLFCVNLPLELTNGTLPGVVAVGDVPTRLNKRLVLTAIIQNFGCVGSLAHLRKDEGGASENGRTRYICEKLRTA